MLFQTLETEHDGRGVCTVWLNRPQKHNAMSKLMIGELSDLADELRQSDIRVVILGARGKTFCSGGDLDWMRQQMDANKIDRAVGAQNLARMLHAWNTLPQPVIGRIHANAFGGGVGLATICDVAVGVEGALMGFPETKLGLIPATIGPYVVARMGGAKARRVFMSSRSFDTNEAVLLGLLASVVPVEQLDEAIEAEVEPYLHCAPGAVASAKELIHGLGLKIDSDIINATVSALVSRWESAEAKEGIEAFFKKTHPPWNLAVKHVKKTF
jgi:methylglutaconyl-CoA hydratase